MPSVSLQKKSPKFQEEPSDLETQLLELGFFCENINTIQHSLIDPGNVYRRGTELPHVDVNRPKGSSFPKCKFPLGDKLYE